MEGRQRRSFAGRGIWSGSYVEPWLYRARIRARMGGQPIVRTILECIREK
jgi:hypothetical protein